MHLEDPLYNKFKESELTGTTCLRGSCLVDFIFDRSTILTAIKRIGTLGLHKGIISDHVMLCMDCDERMLFVGIINQHVMNPSTEFVLEHVDKCEASLKEFRSYEEAKKFGKRIKKLAKNSKTHGPSRTNQDRYQIIDTDKGMSTQCITKGGKEKNGHQQSPELPGHGASLHFWKAALLSKP